MMRYLATMLIGLTSFCLLTTGAVAQSATTALGLTKDTLVEQAKKEGKVVWYTTPGMSNLIKPSLDEWKRRYPDISIEMVESSGPELTERIRTERRASRPVADMVNLGDGLSFQFAAENGYQPLNLPLIPNAAKISPILQKMADDQNRYVPIWVQSYGIVINTKIIPPADEPKKWADLLSPKYARKIALHDFSRVGGGFSWLTIAEPVLGEKFIMDFVSQQQPRAFGRSLEMISAIARGERGIAIPGSSYGILEYEQTAPLKMIYPEDGVFFIVMNAGIVTNAPHPAAATLFLDYLLSPETQKQYSDRGQGPVREDVPSRDISLAKAKLLGAGFSRPADMAKMQTYLDMGAKALRQ